MLFELNRQPEPVMLSPSSGSGQASSKYRRAQDKLETKGKRFIP